MAMTWCLRPCPRCGGNLYRETDKYQETDKKQYSIVCLQCGAHFYPEPPLEDFRIARRRAKEMRAAQLARTWREDD